MIVVTGATGELGRLVIDGLLARVPASQVVAAVRNPDKAAGLGVGVREADYDRPETLDDALAGADTVLLISSNEVGRRIGQHAAVIDAAKRAGVAHLSYTSAPHADTTTLALAPEHKATEQLIRDSGLPFTFLRNAWYHENYLDTIRQGAATGVVVGSAGDGRVASAARADYAAAAVEVLTGAGHENKVYELTGDAAWSFAELAAQIAKVAGSEVGYQDLSAADHRAVLTDAGLPAQLVDLLVTLDAEIGAGLLAGTPGELRALIGRPTTPVSATVEAALRS